MSYRDDLEAALARIDVLEAELARLKVQNTLLHRANEELAADAAIGRKVRLEQKEGFNEERLREQMRREEAEVEAKIRGLRDELRRRSDD
jgi:hypothetical protein